MNLDAALSGGGLTHPDDLPHVQAQIALLTPDRPVAVTENRLSHQGIHAP
jgi:hypothetical protein